MSEALKIVSDLPTAVSMLQPMRLRMLELLRSPGSATTLAKELGEPRQKVNYHLRELEKAGLLELVETRMRRNCEERIVQASARSYLISPEIIGSLGDTAGSVRDRFSSYYQAAVLNAMLRDLAYLNRKADEAGKRIATITLQSSIRFAGARQRNAFAEELATCLAELTARYHDEQAENGREFSFAFIGLPKITDDKLKQEQAGGAKAGAKTEKTQ